METDNLDISIVVPLFNEEESLPELISWIDRVCSGASFSYEAILIDDGSKNQGKKMVIWECITKDKIPFSARPSTTNEDRMKLYQDAEKYLGKKLTVKYFGFSEEGIPRFPVGKDIREDY